MVFNIGDRYWIEVYEHGEMEVVITDIISGVIFYESKPYENSCHVTFFKDMIIY